MRYGLEGGKRKNLDKLAAGDWVFGSADAVLYPELTFRKRAMGFEPTTNSLEGCDSTTELRPQSPVRKCSNNKHFQDV